MKEDKLILMKNKVDQLGKVVNQLIVKLSQVDQMSKGTLTAFQLHIGKDEWEKVVDELKNIEERKNAAAAGINKKKLDLDVE